MNEPSFEEFHRTLDQVAVWPVERRMELATLLLAQIAGEQNLPGSGGKKSMTDLAGILKTDGPAPTDEEIEELLDQERMRKYGQ